MIPTTARTRRRIADTVLKVGELRGNPRIFQSNRRLLTAGFGIGSFLAVSAARAGTLLIEKSATPTTKTAHARGELPCIDISEKILLDTIGHGGTVFVRIEEGRITISRHALDPQTAAAERPRDGTFADIYAGAGLATLAAKQAGLRSTWCVERDPDTIDWHAANHPDTRHLEMTAAEALFAPDLEPCEILFSGIPCQPFSALRRTTSAQTKRDATDLAGAHPLGGESLVLFATVARLLPRTVVIENVRNYLTNDLSAGLQRALEQLGYVVEARVLDANDYGSVAGRPRAFIVGQTPDADGTAPDPWPVPHTTRPRLGDVLDTDVPEEAWFDATTKPHLFERSASNAEKGRGFQLRGYAADATRISGITGESFNGFKIDNPYIAHPTKPATMRRLTMTEARRMMGVPDSFALPAGATRAGELLGQGVYVPLVADLLRRASGRDPSAARRLVAPGMVIAAVPHDTADLPLFS